MKLINVFRWIENPDNRARKIKLTNSVFLINAWESMTRDVYLIPFELGGLGIEITYLELLTSSTGSWSIYEGK